MIAAVFRPSSVLSRTLLLPALPARTTSAKPVLSTYVSGRDIGDEYRYILARRAAPRRPGMLLDKPSLLLKLWALRTTSNALQTAASGDNCTLGGRVGAAAQPRRTRSLRLPGPLGHAGLVRLPERARGHPRQPPPRRARHHPHLARPARRRPARPRRRHRPPPELQRRPPAPEKRRPRTAIATCAWPSTPRATSRKSGGSRPSAGATIVVDDVRTGKLELRGHASPRASVLLTLDENDDDAALRDFTFVTQWPSLPLAEQQRLYSKYACHELNLFLSIKDPPFFARVIPPHIAHKLHPTFLDRYLLGEDLRAFLDPWAFGRLNTLDNPPRPPRPRDCATPSPGSWATPSRIGVRRSERDARLVDTLLGAAGLEGGGIGGAASEAAELAMPMEEMERGESTKMMRKRKGRPRRTPSKPTTASSPWSPTLLRPPSRPHRCSSAPAHDGACARGPRRLRGRRPRGARPRRPARAREIRGPLRSADKTQEWAETAYWKKRIEEITPTSSPPTASSTNLALHREGPFLSPHLGDCAVSFTGRPHRPRPSSISPSAPRGARDLRHRRHPPSRSRRAAPCARARPHHGDGRTRDPTARCLVARATSRANP